MIMRMNWMKTRKLKAEQGKGTKNSNLDLEMRKIN